MTVDPARAALVLKEYRYVTAPDSAASAAIRSKFDKAITIEIDTNLDQDGATELAEDLAGVTTEFSRTFSFTIDEIVYPEDLAEGLSRYTLVFDRHFSDGAYTIVGVKVDFTRGTTVMTVRGS